MSDIVTEEVVTACVFVSVGAVCGCVGVWACVCVCVCGHSCVRGQAVVCDARGDEGGVGVVSAGTDV